MGLSVPLGAFNPLFLHNICYNCLSTTTIERGVKMEPKVLFTKKIFLNGKWETVKVYSPAVARGFGALDRKGIRGLNKRPINLHATDLYGLQTVPVEYPETA
tara:strand:+ start:826 stop:1131 length:306 start_codon:yes stop_codon:yes gene_type:complete